ncbi:hypothetical protein P7H19_09665 [Paenibacillus larvae]|nr:hypothetical protein [Paenibacillus larvae]MDT2236499.1 hypothetical protein [Paenibacillus larvae]
MDWPDKVHVFPADRVESVEVTTRERGIIAEVHGMSFASASVTENLARYYRAGRPDVYQIALLHTNVDGDPSHDNYAPARDNSSFKAECTIGRLAIFIPVLFSMRSLTLFIPAIFRGEVLRNAVREDAMWFVLEKTAVRILILLS